MDRISQAQRMHAAGRRQNQSENDDANSTSSITGMSLDEAKRILNVTDISNKDLIKKHYDHLFSINDKSKAGSFYIQSKVYRAKERIEQEKSPDTSESN
ncbi:hypothetical protein GJ496_006491 [Pomphorhynchus laevis]|nr:hypothetical protein GJ496_006491 [Pomphorhynchus laevis]